MANLEDIATFIDSIKNVLFAVIFVLAGFYVTVHSGIPQEYASQWINAAMLVGGVYIGQRIGGKGKQPVSVEPVA